MSSDEYSGSCSDTDSSDNDNSFDNYFESEDYDLVSTSPINSLVDKNGTLWSTERPLTSRTAVENILNQRYGVSPFVSQNVNDMTDTFKVFFCQDMYDMVIKYTNQHGKEIFSEGWANLDETELDGFFACLLFMGIYHDGKQPIKELFGLQDGRKIYRDLFSLRRFRQIIRALHFDDMDTRNIRKQTDKFCHIRELWDIWVDVLARNYRPSEDLCIDEQLVSFRGRCKFKQYMPKKPSKYGIKFFLLVDPRYNYVCNLDVYLGKRSYDTTRAINVGQNVVMKLIDPFRRSGRNIVCDNFFTSVELAENLLRNKLTILGTMRSNKRDIPPYLRPNNMTPINSSLFVFNGKNIMLRYLPRKSKPVYMLCSSSANTRTATEEPYKPDIIMHYNAAKGGVDTIARLFASISVRRINRRWPLIVFFNMIDISLVNAFCIFKELFPEIKLVRREFLKKMAECLAKALLLRKNQNTVVPQRNTVIPESRNYSRCRYCLRKKDKKNYNKMWHLSFLLLQKSFYIYLFRVLEITTFKYCLFLCAC